MARSGAGLALRIVSSGQVGQSCEPDGYSNRILVRVHAAGVNPTDWTARATGGFGLRGGAAYVSSVIFLPDLGMREAAQHPLTTTANALAALAFGGLAITLPGLARVSRLPRWALHVTAAGAAFVAAITWAMATLLPHIARFLSDAQLEQESVYFAAFWLPKIPLMVIGLLGLAIAGWRRRAIPLGVCLLLSLAAVVSLILPPWPGAVLAGIGLAWMARSARPA